MNVTYRLRQNSIQIDINGKQLSKQIKQSVGIKIEAKHWNSDKGCIELKSYESSEKAEAKKIQDRLDFIKTQFIHNAVTMRQGKFLPIDEAKEIIASILGEKVAKKDRISLKSIAEGYIASNNLAKESQENIRKYARMFGENTIITDITAQKLADFKKQSKLSDGSKQQVLANVKRLLKFALTQGYKIAESALNYESKLKKSKKVNYTALSLNDIKLLESLDLTTKLAETRDWFIFACLHGQRFSDWNRLTQSSNLYSLFQKKTKSYVEIPRFKKLDAYFEKTQGLRLKASQNINLHLKEIAKTFNETFNKKNNLTCHTARVTFISIALNEIKLTFAETKKISGHSDSTMMLHYNQMSEMQAFESSKTKLDAI